jgi:preprotein translocase subunit SecF
MSKFIFSFSNKNFFLYILYFLIIILLVFLIFKNFSFVSDVKKEEEIKKNLNNEKKIFQMGKNDLDNDGLED